MSGVQLKFLYLPFSGLCLPYHRATSLCILNRSMTSRWTGYSRYRHPFRTRFCGHSLDILTPSNEYIYPTISTNLSSNMHKEPYYRMKRGWFLMSGHKMFILGGNFWFPVRRFNTSLSSIPIFLFKVDMQTHRRRPDHSVNC